MNLRASALHAIVLGIAALCAAQPPGTLENRMREGDRPAHE
jgi:hypothetical protein